LAVTLLKIAQGLSAITENRGKRSTNLEEHDHRSSGLS